MAASPKRKIISTAQSDYEKYIQPAEAETPCTCSPLSTAFSQTEEITADEEQMVTGTSALNASVRHHLQHLCRDRQAVSVILLHVSQVESLPLAPRTALPRKRRRFHAPAGFMEQLLANIRRVIRANDEILVHAEAGAVIILPGVDHYSAQKVSERMFHSINLIQAETVIPPLARETSILLGYGSYPEPGHTLEQLLAQTGTIIHRLILRPALTTRHLPPAAAKAGTARRQPAQSALAPQRQHSSKQPGQAPGNVPFMQLPDELPANLKQLLPYTLARQLCCAPVGKEQNTLTIAMAHPLDNEELHLLAQVTGLTIFPVACEEAALAALLTKDW